jgi:hypothetical protein
MLFGSGRDASFVRSISKELINKNIDTEVEYYKLSMENTRENLYGEAPQKVYFNPVKVNCIIQKDDLEGVSDVGGYDFNRTAIFAFLRDTLKDLNIVAQEGDIVRWDTEYFELNAVNINQYWGGRNPDTVPAVISGETTEHGYNVAIVCSAHLTRLSKVNIIQPRAGINRSNSHILPRNI